jgi:hypothetical protein
MRLAKDENPLAKNGASSSLAQESGGTRNEDKKERRTARRQRGSALFHIISMISSSERSPQKEKLPQGSAQRIEKAQFGNGNQSPCISVRGGSWLFARAQFVLVEQ